MKVKLTIPDSLNEISVKQLKDFSNIQENDPHADFLAISILCNVSVKDAMMLPVDTAYDIIKRIQKAVESKQDHVKRFTLNGVEYGFIPNLEEMSFGEYVDLDTYFKIDKDNYDYTNAEKFMAVCYRPITESYKGLLYDIEPYDGTKGRDKIMLEAPASALQSSLVFFCDLSRKLLKRSKPYLALVEKHLIQENHSVENGGGMEALTHLLEETLPNTERLQNYLYHRLSLHLNIKQTRS